MRHVALVCFLSVPLLMGCGKYERQSGCDLDKLNIRGDVRKVETIVQTTIPMTEMIAKDYDPHSVIATLGGNTLLEFDNKGNIKKYAGYGIDGEQLFSVRSFSDVKAAGITPKPIGMYPEPEHDDVRTVKNDDGRVVEAVYLMDGKQMWKTEKAYDTYGNVTEIMNDYGSELTDKTTVEYLGYDAQKNWTEAIVTFKGLKHFQDFSYHIKRRITYEGQESDGRLIDQLDSYNSDGRSWPMGQFKKVPIGDYGDISIPDFMKNNEENRLAAAAATPQCDYLYAFEFYEPEETYATILISTTAANGFPDLESLTSAELEFDKATDNLLEEQMAKQLKTGNMRLLKWMHYDFTQINGSRCMVHRYYRYGIASSIPVYVESYTFNLPDDRILSVLFSVQSNKKDLLTEQFREAIKTLRL